MITGIPPISLLDCTGDDLVDYKIYGNTVQDETPTNVGDLITDTTDVNYGKYSIPIKSRRKNFFAIDGFDTTSTLLITKINNTSFTLTAKTSGIYRQSGTKFLIRVADLKNNFLTVKAENVIKTSKGTPLFIIRQYDKKQQLLAQLKNCQLTTSEVKVSLSNLNPETAWLGGILCLSNVNETAGAYCTITDLQIYDGADDSIITNIYLDEPLRKTGDYADYIDFKNQKIVRYEDSVAIEENIELPKIPTLEDTTVLQINTKIQPSNMEVKYYKKGA